VKRAQWMLSGTLVLGAVAAFPWGGDGTDDQAVSAVEQLKPSYVPWRTPWFEPSEQAEKFLFVVQAAVGGAVLGWAIAKRRAA
jgi:cobalt transport protein